MLDMQTIRERAAKPLAELTGAEYLRTWRARRALRMPTKRSEETPSQAALLASRKRKRKA